MESMDRLSKLLSVAIAVLIVIAGVEAYIIQIESSNIEVRRVHVACIGDSLTRGTEYTLFLWDQLGSDYIIGDFGVGGTTVTWASEKPYMNESAFKLAQNFQPDIVIIMLGTNDATEGLNETTETFIEDYKTLLSAFLSLQTNPDIWVVQPPPIYNSTGLSNTVLVSRVLPGIEAVANQTGVTLVDAYTPLLNHADYFTDGVHPDADGAKIIADTIYAKIAPILPQPSAST
jgi:acyl-CoA thioesterase-1